MSKSFLKSSSIHGFKYISKDFHWTERIFWTVSMIFSVVCTSLLIFELIMKIKNFPIVVYMSDNAVSIDQIDFPAVTICTPFSNKVSAFLGMDEPQTSKWENFEKTDIRYKEDLHDFKITNQDYFELLQKLENGEIKAENLNIRILKRLQIVDMVAKQGTFERKNLTVTTDNLLYNFNKFFKLRNAPEYEMEFMWAESHSTAVSEVMTANGICRTFNFVPSSYIFDENITTADFFHEYGYWFLKQEHQEFYPKRFNMNNKLLYFQFFAMQSFYDSLPNSKFDGFTIQVHDPYGLPAISGEKFMLMKTASAYLFVDLQLNVIDESLMDAPVEERNCYMKNEKVLKFFKVYMKTNCEHECIADYVLNRCGCVEFFMIRNYTTRICSASEMSCYLQAKHDFEEHKDSCRCLQPCNYVKYEVELVHLNTNNPPFKLYKGRDMWGSAKFLYRKTFFNQLIRKKQFNEIDFLSFVGGLLGLFAGFSTLSFFEIIYWIFRNMVKKVTGYRRRRIVGFIKQNSNNEFIRKNEAIQILIVRPLNSQSDEIEDVIESHQGSIFSQYFENSSIHGFNYLSNYNIFETVFWVICIIFSISFCLTLISQTNDKLPDSRVIAYDENSRAVEDVPFPAVRYRTIETADNDFASKAYTPFDEETKNKILNNQTLYDEFTRNATKFVRCFSTRWNWIRGIKIDPNKFQYSLYLETSMADYFSDNFASFNRKYSPVFAEVLIGIAKGYSFNLADAKDVLNIEQNIKELIFTRNITMKNSQHLHPLQNNSYPIKMNINDKFAEFILKLKPQPEVDDKRLSICWYSSVLVHDPYILPVFDKGHKAFMPHPGRIYNVKVIPEITRTDLDLKKLSPETRGCYFDGEKSLRYFKIYKKHYCDMECFANHSEVVCGCAALINPIDRNDMKNFCSNTTHFDCSLNFEKSLFMHGNFSYEKNCSCLPTCNSISYNLIRTEEIDPESSKMITIIVRMQLDEAIFFRRYQQFTFSDVISYAGGLLGLFAGISMLSIVEIFYFFIIRLSVDLWRYLRT